MPKLILAYDADCGPCTRFKRLVSFIDTKDKIDSVSLDDADARGLLASLPKLARHTSFQLVLKNGQTLSGAAAIPYLTQILPLGRGISKVATSAPGGPRLIDFVYKGFARLHDGGSCSHPRSTAGSRFNMTERISGAS